MSNSINHLYFHLILTIKYRKKLLSNSTYDTEIKSIITSCQTKNWKIEKMESDKDHIHLCISASPAISVGSIIKIIKHQTTIQLWKKYETDLKKEFWKNHILWSRSHFCSTIGSVSKEAIENYILNQGK